MSQESSPSPSSLHYTHIVTRPSEYSPFVRHFREMRRPSGLSVLTEIARTHLLVRPSQPSENARTSSGLYLPTLENTITATLTREHETDVVETSIECNDLPEFTAKGKTAWREILQALGGTASLSISLELVEKRTPIDAQRPSGLWVPADDADEFDGYVASPEEIEALEKLAANPTFDQADLVTSDESEPSIGNYL